MTFLDYFCSTLLNCWCFSFPSPYRLPWLRLKVQPRLQQLKRFACRIDLAIHRHAMSVSAVGHRLLDLSSVLEAKRLIPSRGNVFLLAHPSSSLNDSLAARPRTPSRRRGHRAQIVWMTFELRFYFYFSVDLIDSRFFVVSAEYHG